MGRSSLQVLERLASFCIEALDATAPEPLLARTLDLLMAEAGADMGAVFRPVGASLRIVSSRGLPIRHRGRPPLLTTAAWAETIHIRTSGEPAPSVPLNEMEALGGIPTWATAPVAPRGRLHGLLLIASRDLVGFAPEVAVLLEITTRIAGLALESPPGPPSGPPPVPTQVGPSSGSATS